MVDWAAPLLITSALTPTLPVHSDGNFFLVRIWTSNFEKACLGPRSSERVRASRDQLLGTAIRQISRLVAGVAVQGRRQPVMQPSGASNWSSSPGTGELDALALPTSPLTAARRPETSALTQFRRQLHLCVSPPLWARFQDQDGLHVRIRTSVGSLRATTSGAVCLMRHCSSAWLGRCRIGLEATPACCMQTEHLQLATSITGAQADGGTLQRRSHILLSRIK